MKGEETTKNDNEQDSNCKVHPLGKSSTSIVNDSEIALPCLPNRTTHKLAEKKLEMSDGLLLSESKVSVAGSIKNSTIIENKQIKGRNEWRESLRNKSKKSYSLSINEFLPRMHFDAHECQNAKKYQSDTSFNERHDRFSTNSVIINSKSLFGENDKRRNSVPNQMGVMSNCTKQIDDEGNMESKVLFDPEVANLTLQEKRKLIDLYNLYTKLRSPGIRAFQITLKRLNPIIHGKSYFHSFLNFIRLESFMILLNIDIVQRSLAYSIQPFMVESGSWVIISIIYAFYYKKAKFQPIIYHQVNFAFFLSHIFIDFFGFRYAYIITCIMIITHFIRMCNYNKCSNFMPQKFTPFTIVVFDLCLLLLSQKRCEVLNTNYSNLFILPFFMAANQILILVCCHRNKKYSMNISKWEKRLRSWLKYFLFLFYAVLLATISLLLKYATLTKDCKSFSKLKKLQSGICYIYQSGLWCF